MKNNKALRWEVVGVFLIYLVGTSLHFWFEWSGYWRPVAVFAAVNESTWEHFKMAFWPALVFALVEYPFLRNEVRNFWFAKLLALVTMPIVTAILFYGYTAILGQHSLIIDIIIFFLSICAGQLVSYKIMTSEGWRPIPQWPAVIGIVLLAAVYSSLSYYPMQNFLFADPETQEYGILDHYGDHEHDLEHDTGDT